MVAGVTTTPLVRLADDVYAKCEFLHPGRSHKARVARALVHDAEANGHIGPGSPRQLLERTGGNLGIALAMEAAACGYQLTLVTDPYYAPAKRRLAAQLGATIVDRLVSFPDCSTSGEAIEAILAEDGDKFHYLNQFANPANPRAHEIETGTQLRDQLLACGLNSRARIALVLGLGTGASMAGISRTLRATFSRLETFAVEPAECDLRAERFGVHNIQGIAVGEPAPFCSVSELDGVVSVTDDDVAQTTDALLRRHRLWVGPSSAANVAAIARLRTRMDPPPIAFVTLLYDRGEDYA